MSTTFNLKIYYVSQDIQGILRYHTFQPADQPKFNPKSQVEMVHVERRCFYIVMAAPVAWRKKPHLCTQNGTMMQQTVRIELESKQHTGFSAKRKLTGFKDES